MNRMLKVTGAALSLSLASAAGAAQAAVYTINLYGTVSSGFDDLGMFGGGDLTGKTVHGQFIIDTSKGVTSELNNEFYPSLSISGFGSDNPISSQIRVGSGPVYAVTDASSFGSVSRYNSFSDGSFYRVETYSAGAGIAIGQIAFSHQFQARNPLFNGIPGFSLEPVDFGSLPGLSYSASFNVYKGVPGFKGGVEGQKVAYFDYTVDSFTPAAVPEPQIWAILLIGFGVTGVALQQGRKARREAAAQEA